MRRPCAVLLELAIASGCASTPKSTVSNAQLELHRAREALMAGQTDLALLRLEKARMLYRGPNPEYVTLLMAETRLRQEEPAAALALARQVLEEDRANATAHEVAGKSLVKLNRFDEAEQAFVAARDAYDPQALDYRRIEDYVRLSRGLGAYAKADPDVAFRYWDSIQDAQLRYALDEAVKDATRQ